MAKVTNKDRFGNPLTFDQMLKRFKKQVEKDQILLECRKREYFLPKSVKRKQKSARHQRMLNKMNKNKH